MTRLNRGSTKYNQLRINNRQMASFFAQWATVIVADLSEMIRIIQYLSWGFYDWNTFSSSRFTGLAMQIAETITKHSFWIKSHSPALCFDHQAVMQWSQFSFLAGFIDLPKDWLWWILLKLNINEYQTLTFEPCPIHVDISSADFKKF